MSYVYTFGIFAIGAYILQVLLGLIQVKHFTKIYRELRQKGKVAIGRKTGKFKAGTIVLFAIEDEGEILDVRLMQGVTILSKFQQLSQFVGHDLHYIDRYHPLVREENELTQFAMENAREVYLQVTTGNYIEEPASSPIQKLGIQLNLAGNFLKTKVKEVFGNGNNC